MIFSTNQIPELQTFSIKERQALMAIANTKLTVPEKLILNLIKLCLIIPPFMYLSAKDVVGFVIALVLVLSAYAFIMRPIALMFARKNIASAIKKFEAEKDQD